MYLKRTQWALIGNVGLAATQWALLVIVARTGGAEQVGVYALATAITTPASLLVSMGLRVIAATAGSGGPGALDLVVSRVLGAGALVLLAALAVTTPWIEGELAQVVFAMSISKAIDSVSDVVYGVHQARGEINEMATSMLLRAIGGALLFAIPYLLTESLSIALWAMSAGWLLVLLTRDVPSAGLSSRQISEVLRGLATSSPVRRRFYELASRAAPLGLASVLYSFETMTPRYFIEAHVDTAALGVFSASTLLLVGGELVVRSLNQSASSALGKEAGQPRSKAFASAATKLFAASFIVAALTFGAALLFGKQFLVAIYGPEFAQGAPLLVGLSVVALPVYLNASMGYVLTALRIIRLQALTIAVAVAINIALCAVLVPRLGSLGAATAWGISLCLPLAVGMARILKEVRRR